MDKFGEDVCRAAHSARPLMCELWLGAVSQNRAKNKKKFSGARARQKDPTPRCQGALQGGVGSKREDDHLSTADQLLCWAVQLTLGRCPPPSPPQLRSPPPAENKEVKERARRGSTHLLTRAARTAGTTARRT